MKEIVIDKATENRAKLLKSIPQKVQPLYDRVLILADDAEKITAGGIIIPETLEEPPKRGLVVALGTGVKDMPFVVNIGDTVLYGKFAGSTLEVEGIEFMIMRESDILAILP